MKFIIPNVMGENDNDAIVADTFWENFYLSHAKTAMLCISVITTTVFASAELAGVGTERLEMAFFLVVGYWTGVLAPLARLKGKYETTEKGGESIRK